MRVNVVATLAAHLFFEGWDVVVLFVVITVVFFFFFFKVLSQEIVRYSHTSTSCSLFFLFIMALV